MDNKRRTRPNEYEDPPPDYRTSDWKDVQHRIPMRFNKETSFPSQEENDSHHQHPHRKRDPEHSKNGNHQPKAIHGSPPLPKNGNHQHTLPINSKTRQNFTETSSETSDKYVNCCSDIKIKRRILILIVVVVLCVLVLVVVLAVVMTVLHEKGGQQKKVNSSLRATIVNKNFTAAMRDPNSQDYNDIATPFCREMDSYYLTSALSDGYQGCKITALSPGSIVVDFDLAFITSATVNIQNQILAIIDQKAPKQLINNKYFLMIDTFQVTMPSLTSPPQTTKISMPGSTTTNSATMPPSAAIIESSSASQLTANSGISSSSIMPTPSLSSTDGGSRQFSGHVSTERSSAISNTPNRTSTSTSSMHKSTVKNTNTPKVTTDVPTTHFTSKDIIFLNNSANVIMTQSITDTTPPTGKSAPPASLTASISISPQTDTFITENTTGALTSVTRPSTKLSASTTTGILLPASSSISSTFNTTEAPSTATTKEDRTKSIVFSESTVTEDQRSTSTQTSDIVSTFTPQQTATVPTITSSNTHTSALPIDTTTQSSNANGTRFSTTEGTYNTTTSPRTTAHAPTSSVEPSTTRPDIIISTTEVVGITLSPSATAVTARITVGTTIPVPTTTNKSQRPALSVKKISASLLGGSTVLECTLRNPGEWENIYIWRRFKGSRQNYTVLYRSEAMDTPTDAHMAANFTVSTDNVTLRLVFNPVLCQDEGVFFCSVQAPYQIKNDIRWRMTVIAPPKKPNITIPVDLVVGRTSDIPFHCVGDVGYPGGRLDWRIRPPVSAGFTRFRFRDSTSFVEGDCNKIVDRSFFWTASVEWNQTEVKCTTYNKQLNQEVDSSIFKLNIAPSPTAAPVVTTTKLPLPTVPATTPNPQINSEIVTMSDATVNINEGPVTLTCTLQNASDWSLVAIGFTKVNETSTQVMANVTSAGVVTSSSWISPNRVSFQMSSGVDVVSISITLTQALCSDLGNYSCQIIAPFQSMRGNGELVTLVAPEKPTLVLPIEIIAGREIAAVCTGQVGYPRGHLQWATRQKSAGSYSVVRFGNDELDGEWSLVDCMYYFTKRLLFSPSMAANGTWLRCTAINNDAITTKNVSDAKEILVLPFDICANASLASASTNISHPYTCTKYVVCRLSIPRVLQCPSGSCFRAAAGVCVENVVGSNTSPPTQATTQSTATPSMSTAPSTATSTVRPTGKTNTSDPPAITMDDVTGTIGDKGVLTCDIDANQPGTWDYVVISFLEDDGEVFELASLDPSGQTSVSSASRWSHVSGISNVTDMHVAFTLTFNGLRCTDERSYTCQIEGKLGGVQPQANISLIAKPIGLPDLMIPLAVVAGEPLNAPITCTSDVGYPNGNVVWKIRTGTSEQFFALSASNSISTRADANCTTIVTSELTFNPTMAFNDSDVMCQVENSDFYQVNSGPSTTGVLQILPENFCKQKEIFLADVHPYACDKFTVCYSARKLFVFQCDKGQCFDPEASVCEDTMNATTTTVVPTVPADAKAVLTFPSVTSDLTETRLYMSCRMNFGGNWSTLSIKKRYKNGDTMTPLASMSSNRNMTVFNTDAGRVSSSYSIGFNYVTLRITFSPPVCDDEAIYFCFIDESDLNPTTEAVLNIIIKPMVTSLRVPDVIVDGDTSLSAVCETMLGHPSGRMKWKIKYQNDTRFSNLRIQDKKTRINNGCTRNITSTLPLPINMTWHMAELMCVIEGSDVETTSTARRIRVIRRDFCANQTSGAVISHPYTCTKFIQCLSGKPLVQNCPPDLCFNPVAGICDFDIQLPELSMSSVLAEVGSSGVGIGCILTDGEIWSTVTIQRLFVNGSSDAIVNLTTSGISVDPRYQATYVIEGTDATATVMFNDVKCEDAGNYRCFLEGSNYPVAPVTGNLTITGMPTKPLLFSPLDVIENASAPFVCEGHVRYPNETLLWMIKRFNEASFHEYPFVSTENVTQGPCSTNVRKTTQTKLDSSWNQTSIRCQTEDGSYISDETEIVIIAASYCSGHALHSSIPHPFTCRRYITCLSGYFVVNKCPPDLCYSQDTQGCHGAPSTPVDDLCNGRAEGEIFANDDDCTRYYQCNFQKAVPKICPQGLVFEPGIKTCVFPNTNLNLNCTMPA